jgi:hypothetical protein
MDDELQRGPKPEKGSTLNPVYSVRSMKCFAVTESELRQLSLVNNSITATFGIGSGLLAFGANIFSSALFTDKLPATGIILRDSILPICLLLGIVFWLFSGGLWLWRNGFLKLIKKESDS